MGIKELCELQGEFDSLKEENEQMEDKLVTEHGLSREKVWTASATCRCFGKNAVMCCHLSGGGGWQVAHGHQQSGGAVLPRCTRTSAEHKRAVDDGHGEGTELDSCSSVALLSPWPLSKSFQEYITDQSETEKRARRLMESESAETSRAAPTDKKRERESLKKQQANPKLSSSRVTWWADAAT